MVNREQNPYRVPHTDAAVHQSRIDPILAARMGLGVLAVATALYLSVPFLVVLLDQRQKLDQSIVQSYGFNLVALAIWNLFSFGQLPGRVSFGVIVVGIQAWIGYCVWLHRRDINVFAVIGCDGVFVVAFVAVMFLLHRADRDV